MAGLTFTAVASGAAGNLISVNILTTDANNQTLTVTVVGNAISILLGTGPTGIVTTTVAQLAAAMAASVPASALVTFSYPGLSPAGLVSLGCGPKFLTGGGGGGGGLPEYCGLDKGNYKILLLDTNRIQTSNVPLLFSNLFHVPNRAVSASGASAAAQSIPKNYWPTPAMLYKVNTSLSFYLYVTSATPLAGAVSLDLLFSGVRRYPCH